MWAYALLDLPAPPAAAASVAPLTLSGLKAAFHRKALLLHPDKMNSKRLSHDASGTAGADPPCCVLLTGGTSSAAPPPVEPTFEDVHRAYKYLQGVMQSAPGKDNHHARVSSSQGSASRRTTEREVLKQMATDAARSRLSELQYKWDAQSAALRTQLTFASVGRNTRQQRAGTNGVISETRGAAVPPVAMSLSSNQQATHGSSKPFDADSEASPSSCGKPTGSTATAGSNAPGGSRCPMLWSPALMVSAKVLFRGEVAKRQLVERHYLAELQFLALSEAESSLRLAIAGVETRAAALLGSFVAQSR